jgi:hypothetical protein
MKATIVFEDEPSGLVNVRVEFDPEIHMADKPTAAQVLAIRALESIQSAGRVADDDED